MVTALFPAFLALRSTTGWQNLQSFQRPRGVASSGHSRLFEDSGPATIHSRGRQTELDSDPEREYDLGVFRCVGGEKGAHRTAENRREFTASCLQLCPDSLCLSEDGKVT